MDYFAIAIAIWFLLGLLGWWLAVVACSSYAALGKPANLIRSIVLGPLWIGALLATLLIQRPKSE